MSTPPSPLRLDKITNLRNSHGSGEITPRGARAKECALCTGEFSLLKRKRKCKMCNHYYCSDCCSIKASYPESYNFTSPQLVCNECMPKIFELRNSFLGDDKPQSDAQLSASPTTPRRASKLRRSSGVNVGGTFHTSGDGEVHTAFKMADPVCRLVFRLTGMYQGGKFDRGTLNKAMKLNKAGKKLLKVGKVERLTIPVPAELPHDEWKFDEIFCKPPFLKRKKTRKHKKSKKSKEKKSKKSNPAEPKEEISSSNVNIKTEESGAPDADSSTTKILEEKEEKNMTQEIDQSGTSSSKTKKEKSLRDNEKSESTIEPSATNRKSKKKKSKDSEPASDINEESVPVSKKEKKWDEISVFVYHPELEEVPEEGLPVVVRYCLFIYSKFQYLTYR